MSAEFIESPSALDASSESADAGVDKTNTIDDTGDISDDSSVEISSEMPSSDDEDHIEENPDLSGDDPQIETGEYDSPKESLANSDEGEIDTFEFQEESKNDDSELLEKGILHGVVNREQMNESKEHDGLGLSGLEISSHIENDNSIIGNNIGESARIDSPCSSDSKKKTTKWTLLVIICAFLMATGVIIGIIVLSQRVRQHSPSPTVSPSTNESTDLPSVAPSRSRSEPSGLSTIPSLYPSETTNTPSSYNSMFTSRQQQITESPTISPSIEPTELPSIHPTVSPSIEPTVSRSIQPTFLVSMIPSMSPTPVPTQIVSTQPSMADTVMPSLSPTLPMNDVCEDAYGPLLPDFSSNFGTIVNAGVDYVERCGDIRASGPGVWYYTIGTGGEMMAHTCLDTDFNSKITIFGGTCDKLSCIEANDDYCGSEAFQSAVSWNSKYGELYYILITGVSDVEIGSFNIVVGSRLNDECSTAIGPLVTEYPIVVSGSTVDANANNIACNDFINESKSVWYLVRGTGGRLTVDFCDETDFSVRITILTGSCTDLECLTVSSTYDCTTTWDSELSERYYVLVSGQEPDDTGDFSFRLSTSLRFS